MLDYTPFQLATLIVQSDTTVGYVFRGQESNFEFNTEKNKAERRTNNTE